jgi:hypothetical protein
MWAGSRPAEYAASTDALRSGAFLFHGGETVNSLKDSKSPMSDRRKLQVEHLAAVTGQRQSRSGDNEKRGAAGSARIEETA